MDKAGELFAQIVNLLARKQAYGEKLTDTENEILNLSLDGISLGVEIKEAEKALRDLDDALGYGESGEPKYDEEGRRIA